jgi:hypothetical protein
MCGRPPNPERLRAMRHQGRLVAALRRTRATPRSYGCEHGPPSTKAVVPDLTGDAFGYVSTARQTAGYARRPGRLESLGGELSRAAA